MPPSPSTLPSRTVSHGSASGRPYPTHTPLGQVMKQYGLRCVDVQHHTGIHSRTLTEYLASRKKFTPAHLAKLSRFLQVPPEFLQKAAIPSGSNHPTGSTSKRGDRTTVTPERQPPDV